jgi:hypothetical protein
VDTTKMPPKLAGRASGPLRLPPCGSLLARHLLESFSSIVDPSNKLSSSSQAFKHHS